MPVAQTQTSNRRRSRGGLLGFVWVVVVMGALLLPGCVRVPAWKRGVHADRRMQWTRCGERAGGREHTFAVREGAAGGAGGGGGACGCD
ncbi:MAG: DUF4266 domain-containing protein [Myxococcales bacterium]|nr:DUF4266 domain-containing protein [Myxococcales bacterium]